MTEQGEIRFGIDEEWNLALDDAGPGVIAPCGCAENVGGGKDCVPGQQLWQALLQALPEDRQDMDGSYMQPSPEEEARYYSALEAWEAHVGVVLSPDDQAMREYSKQLARQCQVSIVYGPRNDPYEATCDRDFGHTGPHEGPDPLGFDDKARIKWTGGGSCAGDPLPYHLLTD